jgi:uncharacterized protein YrzB (UPF0473 family)
MTQILKDIEEIRNNMTDIQKQHLSDKFIITNEMANFCDDNNIGDINIYMFDRNEDGKLGDSDMYNVVSEETFNEIIERYDIQKDN